MKKSGIEQGKPKTVREKYAHVDVRGDKRQGRQDEVGRSDATRSFHPPSLARPSYKAVESSAMGPAGPTARGEGELLEVSVSIARGFGVSGSPDERAGIGVRIALVPRALVGGEAAPKGNCVLVREVVPGGPAASHGGIRAGDIITHTNDERVGDASLAEVISRIAGAPGSIVTLRLQRRAAGAVADTMGWAVTAEGVENQSPDRDLTARKSPQELDTSFSPGDAAKICQRMLAQSPQVAEGCATATGACTRPPSRWLKAPAAPPATRAQGEGAKADKRQAITFEEAMAKALGLAGGHGASPEAQPPADGGAPECSSPGLSKLSLELSCMACEEGRGDGGHVTANSRSSALAMLDLSCFSRTPPGTPPQGSTPVRVFHSQEAWSARRAREQAQEPARASGQGTPGGHAPVTSPDGTLASPSAQQHLLQMETSSPTQPLAACAGEPCEDAAAPDKVAGGHAVEEGGGELAVQAARGLEESFEETRAGKYMAPQGDIAEGDIAASDIAAMRQTSSTASVAARPAGDPTGRPENPATATSKTAQPLAPPSRRKGFAHPLSSCFRPS